ncbi:MAG: HD domain-containing protein [Candidatus Margulisiibacteriota bacterium]|nr:MAG: HD domain-containing protein [Candidatus Margulisiibacteriota bacterium]HAR64004.1 phosphohydrolase [Candidatus Margulisiibacteriota bacterium]HCT85524.1 phosphohydrolase [Candidatus Margulisiibacteriota bacterium]HCY37902.1 phosphohydrolase [Candidatus Margulisiibacteriota bacterium]
MKEDVSVIGLSIDKYSLNDIRGYLEKKLDIRRFVHSLEVAKVAVNIASYYKVSQEKAEIAGLLHDCSRYLTHEEYLAIAIKNGVTPDEIEFKSPVLLHAFVSSIIAEEEYSIIDDDILSAIRKHTTGDADMSELDKIIYIADFIEPTRGLDSRIINHINQYIYKDLNRAAYLVVEEVIAYLKNSNKYIHPRTLSFQLNLMSNINEK